MPIAFFADTATYRLLNMYGIIFKHLLKQCKGKTQRLVVSCTYRMSDLHKCNIWFSTFIFTP